MSLDNKVDNIEKGIVKILSDTDITNIKMDGVTVRMGSNIFKLKYVSDAPLDIENEIREEYRNKLVEKLLKIKDVVNSKMVEAMALINAEKSEYKRKEKLLQDQLKDAVSMPNVKWEHAKKGLSVTKGLHTGQLYWYVRRTYWPKFVDRKPINQRTIKKMITPIIVMIITDGDKITGVSTKKITDLTYFQHYHQVSPDCWGEWRFSGDWKIPEDILCVADTAEAILENINTNSIAVNSPRGLPRLSTLRRNLIDNSEVEYVDATTVRVDASIRGNGDTPISDDDAPISDIWST